jgi:GNAT superfamily N-acetyltransferase
VSVKITRVSTQQQLAGIMSLHTANLRRNLSAEEIRTQGFVSAEYTLEYLQRMHAASPSIIAVDGDTVVGYALVADPATCADHELIGDLARVIDRTSYEGRLLQGTRYVMVGQLCVARTHRGRGLVKRMYEHYRHVLADQFDYLITDVARDNPGSLIAHLKCGFQVISTLGYGGIEWDLVLWDWTDRSSVQASATG